jgi:hypothetical protein
METSSININIQNINNNDKNVEPLLNESSSYGNNAPPGYNETNSIIFLITKNKLYLVSY